MRYNQFMKSFKKFLSILFSFLVSSLLFPISSHAQSSWSSINSLCVANGDVATIKGLECLFSNILQVVAEFAGLAFLVMFIYGGFQYLFSSNDDKKVAAASSTLTMAVVGLVGIIISWLILSFISTFTGAPVTIFKIPGP